MTNRTYSLILGGLIILLVPFTGWAAQLLDIKKELDAYEDAKLLTFTWQASSCGIEYADSNGRQVLQLVQNKCNFVIESLCEKSTVKFNVPVQKQTVCFTKVKTIRCNSGSWAGVPSNYDYIKLGGCQGQSLGTSCYHSHNWILGSAKTGNCVALGGPAENPSCGCQ